MQLAVEPDAEPAPMADIRRHEEPFRIGLDEHRLHARRRGAPDGEAAVAVVVGQHHQEGAFLADEERRRAVAQTLAGLGQREADLTDPVQCPLPLHGIDHSAHRRTRQLRC